MLNFTPLMQSCDSLMPPLLSAAVWFDYSVSGC